MAVFRMLLPSWLSPDVNGFGSDSDSNAGNSPAPANNQQPRAAKRVGWGAPHCCAHRRAAAARANSSGVIGIAGPPIRPATKHVALLRVGENL